MKLIHALVFAIVIFVSKAEFSRTNCLDYEPDTYRTGGTKGLSAYSLDFCRSSYFDTTQYVKCCFLKWVNSQGQRRYNCIAATALEFSDIDNLKSKIETKFGEDAIVSLDCKSSYLYGSIFLILALLL